MNPMGRKRICIALFGGTGERFGAPYPKQFISIAGEPLLVITLKALSACPEIDEIHVVSEPRTKNDVYNLIIAHQIKKTKAVISGGASRQQSVYAALEYLDNQGVAYDDLIMIVDGDRPNVDPATVKASFEVAAKKGASVVAVPVTDSILLSSGGKKVDKYLNRDEVYAVQTPQTFAFSLIYEAHKKFADTKATDDASLVSKLGKEVGIVKGNKDNIKITTPEDVVSYLSIIGRRI